MCGVVYIFSKSSWLSCAFSVRQLMRSGPFVSIFRNTSPVRIDRKELPGADKAGVGSWGWCTRSNFDGGGGVSSIPQETCKAGCNLKADNRLMTKIPREICIPSTIPLTCFYQLRRELCSSLCPINASINWKQHTKVKHKKKQFTQLFRRNCCILMSPDTLV